MSDLQAGLGKDNKHNIGHQEVPPVDKKKKQQMYFIQIKTSKDKIDSIPNTKYPCAIPSKKYPSAVTSTKYPSVITSTKYPSAIPSTNYPSAIPSTNYPSAIASTKYQLLCLAQIS